MRPQYPFVIRQAGGRDFLAHVAALARANMEKFAPNPADPVRRKFWEMRDDLDPVLSAKKAELVERFGIGAWNIDPNYHDLIGCIAEGGYIHPHTDPAAAKGMHVRINLLVAEPESGCVPLLDGHPMEVALGDAWLCFASHCEHATTPVVGKQDRMALSYGLQVDRVAVFGLYSQYLRWRMAA